MNTTNTAYNWKLPCLTGLEASKKLAYLLQMKILGHANTEKTWQQPEHAVAGYTQEGAAYVAFDNRTGNCWVEQFKTEEHAYLWCTGQVEATEEIHL